MSDILRPGRAGYRAEPEPAPPVAEDSTPMYEFQKLELQRRREQEWLAAKFVPIKIEESFEPPFAPLKRILRWWGGLTLFFMMIAGGLNQSKVNTPAMFAVLIFVSAFSAFPLAIIFSSQVD